MSGSNQPTQVHRGQDDEELLLLRAEVEALKEREVRRARNGRRRLFLGGLLFASLGLGTALAQPGVTSLIVFSASTPARASDVNSNFALLQTWIEEKLGAVNSPNVDVPGTFNAASVSSEAAVSAGGDLGTNGYLDVEQGAQFRCSGCGSSSTLRGVNEWGNLTIQGRVISADANLHLSPPGGSGVIINDTYRAAGGASTGAGATLDVEGTITARSGVNLPSGRTISNLGISGEYTARRNHSSGNGDQTLISTSSGFCFLTEVSFEDVDSAGESATCRVFESGGNWVLRARLGSTSDSDAWCAARCISW